jgi:hypothetical protein
MSKTSQELKAKKAKKLAVEDQVVDQKAQETPVEELKTETEATETTEKVSNKVVRVRGKKYQAAKKKIDVLKLYSLKEAIKHCYQYRQYR